MKLIERVVEWMISIFNETSLARVWKHIQDRHNIGLITAFRNDRQHDDNRYLTARLTEAVGLPQWGFGQLEVKRYFVDNSKPPETLFILFGDDNDNGRLKGFLRKGGLVFGQEVFVLGSHLHHVGDRKHVEDIGAFRPDRMDEYFNRLIPPDGFHMVEHIAFLKGWTFLTFMGTHKRTVGHPVNEEY